MTYYVIGWVISVKTLSGRWFRHGHYRYAKWTLHITRKVLSIATGWHMFRPNRSSLKVAMHNLVKMGCFLLQRIDLIKAMFPSTRIWLRCGAEKMELNGFKHKCFHLRGCGAEACGDQMRAYFDWTFSILSARTQLSAPAEGISPGEAHEMTSSQEH